MSIKRAIAEFAVRTAGQVRPGLPQAPDNPKSIFVLRNNDLGDVIVVTPLFEALRRRFPQAKIVAGVGAWAKPLLEGNPFINEILEINAPWHNKQVPQQSVARSLAYLATSPEVRLLRRAKHDIGIDVLGSPFGALLFIKANIPWRLGVQGYAGGHSAMHASIPFNRNEPVGRAALRFAELLGTRLLPSIRPQLYLNQTELQAAETLWQRSESGAGAKLRLAVSLGAGLPKKAWPAEHWRNLISRLQQEERWTILFLGGEQDREPTNRVAPPAPGLANLAGQLSLRQSLAAVARADVVLCHSSMLMHAAAAFGRPCVTLLGPAFPSASDHARLWQHGTEGFVLGREPGRDSVATPEEAQAALGLCRSRNHESQNPGFANVA